MLPGIEVVKVEEGGWWMKNEEGEEVNLVERTLYPSSHVWSVE